MEGLPELADAAADATASMEGLPERADAAACTVGLHACTEKHDAGHADQDHSLSDASAWGVVPPEPTRLQLPPLLAGAGASAGSTGFQLPQLLAVPSAGPLLPSCARPSVPQPPDCKLRLSSAFFSFSARRADSSRCKRLLYSCTMRLSVTLGCPLSIIAVPSLSKVSCLRHCHSSSFRHFCTTARAVPLSLGAASSKADAARLRLTTAFSHI